MKVRARALIAAFAVVLAFAFPANAGAVAPSVIADGGTSAWTYADLADVSTKYEGGYAAFDDAPSALYADPHGGYNTTTNKCKVCHAVHRAEGAYYLLRADSQDDACSYCHVGSAHSSTVVYDLNPDGVYTMNGHTIGASAFVPNSSVAQWTESVTITSVDASGAPVTDTIEVRAYDERTNGMYRFARHHGQTEATGAPRANYIPVGPLALRCMSCHQVHNADAMTWQPLSMGSMTNFGSYLGAETGGYKLLKQFPSGTFVGELDAYGQVPIANLSIVPETTLTAGVNFDTVRAAGAEPGALDLVRGGVGRAYNRPMWVAQGFERPERALQPERSNPAAVNAAALSVWCVDCHNLNIGGWSTLATSELGFKAHTERTHPAPYSGAFSGPGQCYSCHRSDLPRVNAGDPCSQCHYGTGNYRENRYAPGGTPVSPAEYVASDFPHSGEGGDYKLLGSYSVDVAGLNPTTIDESVTVGPNNLDAVCLRCHWIGGEYHESSRTSLHVVPAEYTQCLACHVGADVVDLHEATPNGCDSCHASANLSADCATCHAEKLIAHGYEVAQHTATPANAFVRIFEDNGHDDAQAPGDPYDVLVDCGGCHSMELGRVHDGQCSTCHPTPVNTVGTWTGECQQSGCHVTYHEDSDTAHYPFDSDCNQCHGAGWYPTDDSCANCHARYSPSDTTPPVTTSNAVATYVGGAEVKFSITDSGKVGVGTTYYRLDGGPVENGSSVNVTVSGSHTLEFWSVDQAGNVETTHRFASFTVTTDTTPPVTTSNVRSSYENVNASITFSATDNSPLGVKATYYRLDGGPVQTGTSLTVLKPSSGTVTHTLSYWSEDWLGNVEAAHDTSFTMVGGTARIRLVWGDADINPMHIPVDGSWASWTIRRDSWSGPIVSTGYGEAPGWSGVDDIVLPVMPSRNYYIVIDWYDADWDWEDQSAFAGVTLSSDGQIVRLSY